jgi:lauroyl/myristoyl acyltransferase
MRFQEWIEGRWAVRLGLWIGQRRSRRFGYGLSRRVADGIAWLKPEVYWKVHDNLRHVVGPEVGAKALRSMVHAVFEHAGQTYYDFFRVIGQPRTALANSVRIQRSLISFIKAEQQAGRGVLLLGAHMSNFDLGILALGANDLPAQILSLGGAQDGFDLLNDLRQMDGFEVTPVGPMALREAVRRLRSAGLVMTGADRPAPGDEEEATPLFGQPACLPLGPARLALMTGATVLLGACYRDPEEGYVLHVTGPIEMVDTGNRRADVMASTRRLAEVMETYIRARPTQWLMFHRLWPD